MQPSHSWTQSAYRGAAAAHFVAALTAEMRRQEDAFDGMTETLRVQKEKDDHDYLESRKQRYPPDSQLYREDVKNYLADSEKLLSDELAGLRNLYPLGHEGVDPEGALSSFSLRSRLLQHVERIEAERCASAASASEKGSAVVLQRVKVEHSTAEVGPSDGAVSPASSAHPAAPADSSRTGLSSEGHATGEMPPALTSMKQESSDNPDSAFPPLWPLLKPLMAKRVVRKDCDDGAYLMPHPKAAGVALLRYSCTAQPPVYVIPVADPARTHLAKRTNSGKSATPTQRRGRSASPASSQAILSSSSQVTSDACRCEKRQNARSEPHRLSQADAADDRVMQLWQRLWPRPPLRPQVSGSGGNRSTALMRPTAVMANAVAMLALKKLEQEQERCAAEQTQIEDRLSHIHDPVASDNTPQAEAGVSGLPLKQTTGTKRSRPAPSTVKKQKQAKTTKANSAHLSPMLGEPLDAKAVEALRMRQQQLTEQLAQIAAARANHSALLQELLQAIETTPTPAASQAHRNNEVVEEEDELVLCRAHERTSAETAAPAAVGRANGRQRASQRGRSRSTPHSTPGPATAGSQNQPEEALAEEEEALRNRAALAAQRAAVLRSTLRRPRQVLQELQDARHGDEYHTGIQPAESVFATSTTAIETITLPSPEDDADATDLANYLWPAELEARIRHVLHASTDSRLVSQNSYHFTLSRQTVKQLEDACGVVESHDKSCETASLTVIGTSSRRARDDPPPSISVVYPTLASHVLALPNTGTRGWLYVHGRGEALFSSVSLK